MYCSVEEVKTFTGVKPKHFRFERDNQLDDMIISYIEQAESLINSYTNNNFHKNTPPAISNVCLRLVSNMLALYTARRNSPVIKNKDFGGEYISSKIFTNDLKDDLKPFKKDVSHVSDKIDFFAITGD